MKGETYCVHKDQCLLNSHQEPITDQNNDCTKFNLQTNESRDSLQECGRGVICRSMAQRYHQKANQDWVITHML